MDARNGGKARCAVVEITYLVPIDLDEYPDLTDAELRTFAGEIMAELIADEGVQVAPDAPITLGVTPK